MPSRPRPFGHPPLPAIRFLPWEEGSVHHCSWTPMCPGVRAVLLSCALSLVHLFWDPPALPASLSWKGHASTTAPLGADGRPLLCCRPSCFLPLPTLCKPPTMALPFPVALQSLETKAKDAEGPLGRVTAPGPAPGVTHRHAGELAGSQEVGPGNPQSRPSWDPEKVTPWAPAELWASPLHCSGRGLVLALSNANPSQRGETEAQRGVQVTYVPESPEPIGLLRGGGGLSVRVCACLQPSALGGEGCPP